MKNLLLYYFTIFTPLGLLTWASVNDLISSVLFVVLLFLYAFVYRTYTDGMRLAQKGIIERKDIWKIIIPGSHFKYFKELYLE
ncbi:hypothetical protein SB49_09375 [Sediminicola sp. YIK13]|uniref:hypothetical protein n=1 Tax=Sediminicola sp. YIK13 TaxID=1453352 RepID=UPI0007204C89|nr:hypothetical protein [Sediminicola sp. YIK13]ALM07986.1 hypothetical protein SB49_09375 [Sediminicola sp. YIK13]